LRDLRGTTIFLEGSMVNNPYPCSPSIVRANVWSSLSDLVFYLLWYGLTVFRIELLRRAAPHASWTRVIIIGNVARPGALSHRSRRTRAQATTSRRSTTRAVRHNLYISFHHYIRPYRVSSTGLIRHYTKELSQRTAHALQSSL
jgi:hypothetical protein